MGVISPLFPRRAGVDPVPVALAGTGGGVWGSTGMRAGRQPPVFSSGQMCVWGGGCSAPALSRL